MVAGHEGKLHHCRQKCEKRAQKLVKTALTSLLQPLPFLSKVPSSGQRIHFDAALHCWRRGSGSPGKCPISTSLAALCASSLPSSGAPACGSVEIVHPSSRVFCAKDMKGPHLAQHTEPPLTVWPLPDFDAHEKAEILTFLDCHL